MSNILVVTPVPTHPADAGNRARINTLQEALRNQGHQVVLMHVEREKGDREAMREYYGTNYLPVEYLENTNTWQRRKRRWKQRFGRLVGKPLGFTYQLDEWWDSTAAPKICAAIETFDIDVVLANYIFFSRALVGLPASVLKLLDTHDSFANRHERLLAAGLEPAWFSCSTSAEQTGINRSDVVIAIQDKEAQYFQTLTEKEVLTVGHLVDSPEKPLAIPNNKRVLIIGSRNSINVDSTLWFAREVFTRVSNSLPDATLVIAGSVCDDLETLRNTRGVELLGRVDNLANEYKNANVVINPMRAGTGLKIKSIEAMGLGCALVTTSSGAEGLEQSQDRAFALADEPEEMASAIIRLLKNHSEATQLGVAAHAFAQTYNANCMAGLNATLSRANLAPTAEAS